MTIFARRAVTQLSSDEYLCLSCATAASMELVGDSDFFLDTCASCRNKTDVVARHRYDFPWTPPEAA